MGTTLIERNYSNRPSINLISSSPEATFPFGLLASRDIPFAFELLKRRESFSLRRTGTYRTSRYFSNLRNIGKIIAVSGQSVNFFLKAAEQCLVAIRTVVCSEVRLSRDHSDIPQSYFPIRYTYSDSPRQISHLICWDSSPRHLTFHLPKAGPCG